MTACGFAVVMWRLGNRNRRPRAVRLGHLYVGFRGVLNPVVASIRCLTYIYFVNVRHTLRKT